MYGIIFCTTVSHAAINAILNKHAESVDGCTMYITRCPSNEEAKVIIQAGITEVIYFMKIHQDHIFINVTGLNNCLSMLKSGLNGKLPYIQSGWDNKNHYLINA